MGKSILIVDDNELNRKILRVLLQKSGYETFEAVDGEQGVQLAREVRPSLIFMDIQMPVVDGVAALKILRSEDATSKIPVVALTSYAMKGDREKFLEAGFDAYVAKPIDSNEVLEMVREMLGTI
jgi:CheY-like chemotaxis protein